MICSFARSSTSSKARRRASRRVYCSSVADSCISRTTIAENMLQANCDFMQVPVTFGTFGQLWIGCSRQCWASTGKFGLSTKTSICAMFDLQKMKNATRRGPAYAGRAR